MDVHVYIYLCMYTYSIYIYTLYIYILCTLSNNLHLREHHQSQTKASWSDGTHEKKKKWVGTVKKRQENMLYIDAGSNYHVI